MADNDLSDEQVRQLLKDAEQRLKSKHALPSSSSAFLSILQPSSLQIGSTKTIEPYVKSTEHGAEVNPSHLVSSKDRELANHYRVVEDPIAIKNRAAEVKKASAGSDWYNLPRTNLTPELKRDLQLLHMRDVLDPKRHYKKDGSKPRIPEFSQIGTIIEGPTEFFSARLSNKDRKQTLVEEVLAGEKSTQRFKSKYNDIQAAKTSGKKAHYKKLQASRRKGVSKG